jgi:predicted nucleic acid-binding Zn ribbon protein
LGKNALPALVETGLDERCFINGSNDNKIKTTCCIYFTGSGNYLQDIKKAGKPALSLIYFFIT